MKGPGPSVNLIREVSNGEEVEREVRSRSTVEAVAQFVHTGEEIHDHKQSPSKKRE